MDEKSWYNYPCSDFTPEFLICKEIKFIYGGNFIYDAFSRMIMAGIHAYAYAVSSRIRKIEFMRAYCKALYAYCEKLALQHVPYVFPVVFLLQYLIKGILKIITVSKTIGRNIL